MWERKQDIFTDIGLPFFNAVTTKQCGPMRDAAARSICCERMGISERNIVRAEQVHNSDIALVGEKQRGTEIAGIDGLITASAGVYLAIFTADCLPVFLGSKDRKVIGLLHAGWRGLQSGIIPKAITLFKKEYGIDPAGITAAIGPHIRRCCYRVGDALKKAFAMDSKDTHLDLSRIATDQLTESGVANVSLHPLCSCHEETLFYSYRRDKTAGRMMSVIGI